MLNKSTRRVAASKSRTTRQPHHKFTTPIKRNATTRKPSRFLHLSSSQHFSTTTSPSPSDPTTTTQQQHNKKQIVFSKKGKQAGNQLFDGSSAPAPVKQATSSPTATALSPDQIRLQFAREAQQRLEEDELEMGMPKRPTPPEGVPKSLDEVFSKDRKEMQVEFKPIDPNSFKGKVVRMMNLDTAAPEKYKPIKLIEQQPGQHNFPNPIPGTLVYALDSETYKKYVNGDIVPTSTIITSLACLSLWNWDTIATVVWLAAAGAAVWNLYTRAGLITRISAEVTSKNNWNNFHPKTPDKQAVPTIKKLTVETKNFPFSPRKQIVIEPIESVERKMDPSFLKPYIDLGDVAASVANKGYFFVQLDAQKKTHMLLQLDQVRHVGLFNQMLSRAPGNLTMDQIPPDRM